MCKYFTYYILQQFLVHVQQYDLQAYHLMHFNVIYTEVKCK